MLTVMRMLGSRIHCETLVALAGQKKATSGKAGFSCLSRSKVTVPLKVGASVFRFLRGL